MRKRVFALLIAVILCGIYSTAALGATKSDYTMKQVNNLIKNADIIVDGAITKITANGDQIKCKVELKQAYDLNLPYVETPLNYHILLPRGSVTTKQKILLFLKKDSVRNILVKAIDDGSYQSFIYRPEDYNLIKPLVSRNIITRQQLISRRNMERYPDAKAIAADYEKSKPNMINGVYFDAKKSQYLIVLSKGANKGEVQAYMKKNTKNSPHYRLVMDSNPSVANLYVVCEAISEQIMLLNSSQHKQLSFASICVDESKKKIVVEIVGMTTTKIEKFKQMVDSSVWLTFENVDDFLILQGG